MLHRGAACPDSQPGHLQNQETGAPSEAKQQNTVIHTKYGYSVISTT